MAVVIFGKNLLHSNLSLGAIIISGLLLLGNFLSNFISVDKFTWLLPLSVLAAAIPIFILSGHMHIRQILLFSYTVLWATRLFIHLCRRIAVDKLDRRLDKTRHSFIRRQLFYMGMAMLSFAFLLPFALVNSIRPQFQPRFGVMDVLGMLFFLSGWIFEMVADIQLFRWRHNPENEGLVCNSGLWSHMRHPNYFGEFLQWWGMFMLCTPALYGVEWLVILSPLFISLMQLFVSGIPPAERTTKEEFVNDPEYQSYLEDSGVFFPSFTRASDPQPSSTSAAAASRNMGRITNPIGPSGIRARSNTQMPNSSSSSRITARDDMNRDKLRAHNDSDSIVSPPVGVGISS